MAIGDYYNTIKKNVATGVEKTKQNVQQNTEQGRQSFSTPMPPQSSTPNFTPINYSPAVTQTPQPQPAPSSRPTTSSIPRTSPTPPSALFEDDKGGLFYQKDGQYQKIANPDELNRLASQGVIEVGGVRQKMPGVSVAAEPKKMATLEHPETGERIAVEVNSPQAQEAFGRGFLLENKSTVPTAAKAPQPLTTPQPSASEATTPSQRDQLRQAIIEALMPSAQEQSAQRALDTLRGETAQNIAGLEGQGRGITLDLVRGQQGALARQAAAEEANIQAIIDREAANRNSALQAATVALGFEEADERLRLEQEQATKGMLQGLALDLARAGASQEEIQGVLSSTDLGAALAGAGKYLQQPSKLLSVEEAQKLGVPFGTTQAEAAAMNITPQQEQDLLGGMTEQQISIMQNIQNQVRQDPDVKGYIDVRDSFNRIQAAANSMQEDGTLTAAGDLSLIFNYMKMLDPGSTVREGEFANAQNAAGIPDQIRNLYNQVAKGNRLGAAQVQDFMARAKDLHDAKLAPYQDAIQFYTQQAGAFGVPTELVLRDFSRGAGTTSGEGQSLPPLNQSYASLDALFDAHPEYVPIVEQIATETGMSDQEILRLLQEYSAGGGSSGLFTNDLGTSLNGLGSLSEKFESGGDPGAIGYDRTGGYSYGAYQLAHNNAQRFVEQSRYAKDFAGIPFNSEAFRDKWQEIARRDPEGFKREQKAYITKTHYQPQIEKIQRETGLRVDKLSPAMQDVIFSTAVQHGANTDIIINAIKQTGKTTSEQELINKIYDLRWSGGQQFRGSTPQVQAAVKNRLDQERQLALSQTNRFA